MSADPKPTPREERLHEAVLAYFHEADAGRAPSPQEFVARHPDLAADLQAFLAGEERLRSLLTPLRALALTAPALHECSTLSSPEPQLGTVDSHPPAPPVVKGAPEVPGYEILGVLGEGGMGVVYKARQVHMSRVVALKMIRAGRPLGDATRARFRDEAQAVAKFDHPNIVRVYDSSERDGRPYMALEFVDGGSLKDALKDGPWQPRQAAALVATLADATDYAHRLGVVHRDLKPANILLQTTEHTKHTEKRQKVPHSFSVSSVCSVVSFIPKIADFGLAKLREGGAGLTWSGAILGSPAYMAPEQVENAKEVGAAVDVYGLGGILYHLLTGCPPHSGASNVELLEGALDGQVTSPRRLNARVPAALERSCLKALAAAPEQRYPSAAALADDLRRYLARGRRLALAAGTAAALLALGVAAWLIAVAMRPTSAGVAGTPTAATEAPAAALKGWIDLRVWEGKNVAGPRNPHRRGLYLHQLDALPLKVGDEIQVEAELNRPLFVYIVWINSSGKAVPAYPWRGFRWDQRPAEEQAVARLKLPEGAVDSGWEMDAGAPGMETLLLLARETKLADQGEQALKAALAEVGPQPLQDGKADAAVWFENGAVVTAEKGRAPKSFDAGRIDDPVLRTQRVLRDQLGRHCDYTRAVSFAFRGK